MKNLIGYWVHLSRAYEIALLGNFKIEVVFNKDYVQGFDDYSNIKSFFNKVEFGQKGDIVIEIIKPNYSIDTNRFEHLSDIHNRVDVARHNVLPTMFRNKHACEPLLKTAIDRLNLTLSQIDNIHKVASVISQLHGSNEILIEHLAESIQYQCVDMDSMCTAERKSIMFGNGIEISLCELDTLDVNNAIKYLQGYMVNI